MRHAERKVLTVLLRGPAYGLEVMEETGMGWDVYPVLRMLEQRGVLSHYEVADTSGQRGGRPRVYYVLQPLGFKEYLHQDLERMRRRHRKWDAAFDRRQCLINAGTVLLLVVALALVALVFKGKAR
jgi:DNA-binding PadR family transcriptional regulator